jgi:DNA-binding MarR family transcriptional regulator
MSAESYDRWMPAWLSLVRTHAQLWDQVEAQMRNDHGLTMARYDVLASLANAGGRLGLSDLASSILLSQSGLSKLLDRMELSGLVHRDPDPRDARAAFATLTPRGRSMARQARQGHHDFLQHVFGDALDDRDLADLARVMSRISACTFTPGAPMNKHADSRSPLPHNGAPNHPKPGR